MTGQQSERVERRAPLSCVVFVYSATEDSVREGVRPRDHPLAPSGRSEQASSRERGRPDVGL